MTSLGEVFVCDFVDMRSDGTIAVTALHSGSKPSSGGFRHRPANGYRGTAPASALGMLGKAKFAQAQRSRRSRSRAHTTASARLTASLPIGGSYEQAEAMAKRRGFDGVGFVLSEDDDYTGIDLDKCRDPETGKLDLWAEDIVALNETYWEISPSGTGLRAILRGKIAKTIKNDKAHVEIYRSQRYLTITQNHIEGTPEDIRPAPITLEWLMERVEKFAPTPAPQSPLEPTKLWKSVLGNYQKKRLNNQLRTKMGNK